jgi:ribosomal protein S18 acetylase RimI-like enzyme
MADWLVSPLNKDHQRADFACGKAPLDSFLRSLVTQYEKRGLGRTYVVTEPESMFVAGYYTLAAGALDVSVLPAALRKKLPKHPIPTVHLARLAVDLNFRGRRLGEFLLFNALETALASARMLGIFGIDVWAIDDDACAFYKKYGFVALDDAPHHLVMAMKTVEAMFAKP